MIYTQPRFLLALFFLVEILLARPNPLKTQLCFILAALPQIYRQQFASLWPSYAKAIRIALGPPALIFLVLSFKQACVWEIFAVVGGVVLGVLYVPDPKKREYENNKRTHGRIMRVLFWTEVARFAWSVGYCI